MAHELVQLQERTGMKVRRQGSTALLCGRYRGYAMVANLNSRARCYDVVVWASRPGGGMEGEAEEWLRSYAASHPACTGGRSRRSPNRAPVSVRNPTTSQYLLPWAVSLLRREI